MPVRAHLKAPPIGEPLTPIGVIKRGAVRPLYLGVCSAHTNSSSLNFSLREKSNARAYLVGGVLPSGGKQAVSRAASAPCAVGAGPVRLSQLTPPCQGG